jgi:uncharacterized BrkB/YihY/UPF0761 family membrane protein
MLLIDLATTIEFRVFSPFDFNNIEMTKLAMIVWPILHSFFILFYFIFQIKKFTKNTRKPKINLLLYSLIISHSF